MKGILFHSSLQNTIHLDGILFLFFGFFFRFFLWLLFFLLISITLFNIRFIENCGSYFLMYFLWGYFSLMTCTTGLMGWLKFFYPFFLLFFSQIHFSTLNWLIIEFCDLFRLFLWSCLYLITRVMNLAR